jgi:hypothetical protein
MSKFSTKLISQSGTRAAIAPKIDIHVTDRVLSECLRFQAKVNTEVTKAPIAECSDISIIHITPSKLLSFGCRCDYLTNYTHFSLFKKGVGVCLAHCKPFQLRAIQRVANKQTDFKHLWLSIRNNIDFSDTKGIL